MRIYTRVGDKGETSLIGGRKVEKCDQRVETYGTVDEAISAISLARSCVKNEQVKDYLQKIEEDLFILNSELATLEPEKLKVRLTQEEVKWVEKKIDEITENIKLPRDFILPGPYLSSSSLHLARTVVRRAEREAVKLKRSQNIREEILMYLNRLSDFLYCCALFEETEEIIKQAVTEISKSVKEKVSNEMKEGKILFKIAKEIIQKAREKAEEIRKPMCIAVVDEYGYLIAFERMEGALLGSIELAINKAKTAVLLKMETSELHELAKPSGELYGINNASSLNFVTFGGGMPLRWGGQLVGGIGVSGGSVEEDIAVATSGVKEMEHILETLYK